MKKVTVLIIILLIANNSFGQRPKANVETKSGVKSFYLDEIYENRFEDSLGNWQLKFIKTNTTFENIPIKEIETISFSPFGMTNFPLVIKYSNGTSDSISLNDIEYLKFDNWSSVNINSNNQKLSCYPNPVNSGHVFFNFPEGYISYIEIFSIEGIKICELRAECPETSSSIIWDCKNQWGIDILQGIYICRAICSKEIEYLKIIITR